MDLLYKWSLNGVPEVQACVNLYVEGCSSVVVDCSGCGDGDSDGSGGGSDGGEVVVRW